MHKTQQTLNRAFFLLCTSPGKTISPDSRCPTIIKFGPHRKRQFTVPPRRYLLLSVNCSNCSRYYKCLLRGFIVDMNCKTMLNLFLRGIETTSLYRRVKEMRSSDTKIIFFINFINRNTEKVIVLSVMVRLPTS